VKANANKIKSFLLETLCDQYKYQTDTEIDNDNATPMEIYRYIHKSDAPLPSRLKPKESAIECRNCGEKGY
jgi:hypothetical protein